MQNETDQAKNQLLPEAGKKTTEGGGVKYGEGVPFERIRRITGYLVGDINRWNNAKLAELKDRVAHGHGKH